MLTPSTSAAAVRHLTRAASANPTLFRAPAAVIARRTYATPSGPPPKGYRLKPAPSWDQEKEGTFDRIGKYFLLTEMARGMYVLLEQFFRSP
jgi:NADH dehydrogenase (ubiquinone) Fe-S protein 8